MYSPKVTHVVKISRNNFLNYCPVFKISTSCMKFQDNLKKKAPGSMKNVVTTPYYDPKKDPFVTDGISPFFKMFQVEIEPTPQGIKSYLSQKFRNFQVKEQKFNYDRNKILGSDISLAYFIVYHNGKVRFKNQKEWISRGKGHDKMPNRYDPNWILEEVDLSDVHLLYEGLENFVNVPKIRRAIFTRSPLFDDWFLDKVSTLFPLLEYLDVTDCPNLTERGLEALYRTSNLKTLKVTNFKKTAAFELTCMMLEDVVPGLQVDICEPKNKN